MTVNIKVSILLPLILVSQGSSTIHFNQWDDLHVSGLHKHDRFSLILKWRQRTLSEKLITFLRVTSMNSSLYLDISVGMYTLNLEVTLALTLFQSCRYENNLHSHCSDFQKRGLHSTCIFYLISILQLVWTL